MPSFHSDRRQWLCAASALLSSAMVPAWAQDKPRGRVVLTVSGALSRANDGANAVFDMAMLEALPQHSFSTRSPWYEQANTFTGPLLRDVLNAAGAKGQTIVAVALNDYKVEIPFEDAIQHDVIVARLMNGRPMPVRDKGPLFVIYPFDAKAELRAERYYNRAIWQLRQLQVR